MAVLSQEENISFRESRFSLLHQLSVMDQQLQQLQSAEKGRRAERGEKSPSSRAPCEPAESQKEEGKTAKESGSPGRAAGEETLLAELSRSHAALERLQSLLLGRSSNRALRPPVQLELPSGEEPEEEHEEEEMPPPLVPPLPPTSRSVSSLLIDEGLLAEDEADLSSIRLDGLSVDLGESAVVEALKAELAARCSEIERLQFAELALEQRAVEELRAARLEVAEAFRYQEVLCEEVEEAERAYVRDQERHQQQLREMEERLQHEEIHASVNGTALLQLLGISIAAPKNVQRAQLHAAMGALEAMMSQASAELGEAGGLRLPAINEDLEDSAPQPVLEEIALGP